MPDGFYFSIIKYMFVKAYELASKFTLPIITTIRFYDNTVEGWLWTFIVLNKDWWLITAAHNLAVMSIFQNHKKEINEYETQQIKEKIKQNPKRVKDFVISFNTLWVIPIEQSYIHWDNDIAFIKIDSKFIPNITTFPVFKNPKNIKKWISLCKLWFPLHKIEVSYEEWKWFVLWENALPIPRFPIEGIYTRDINSWNAQDGEKILYLETSSPWLKGQSWGPIFDKDWNIYAIQSKNCTLPLWFTWVIEIDWKKVEENQFINVGIGVHVETIVNLLIKYKIDFDIID